jgi:hypothetical protein
VFTYSKNKIKIINRVIKDKIIFQKFIHQYQRTIR